MNDFDGNNSGPHEHLADMVTLPAIDVINMVQLIRNYQTQIAQLQATPTWIEETIDRVKTITGRNFGDE